MCAMISYPILIKYIYYCNYSSIWTVQPYLTRKHHQLVLSINVSLSQEVIYRWILYLGIIYLNIKFQLSIIHLKKCFLHSVCMVCLVFLLFLAIRKHNLLSNLFRGGCSDTTYGSFSRTSLFCILKCDGAITEVYDELNSLQELYWSNGPGICVQWPMVPPW